jgi:hypothetical protein
MNAAAISKVTDALSKRLQTAVADSGASGTVFIGPLDDPQANGAPLVLFLYRIMPNATLRNSEHAVAATTPPPPVIVYRDSLPLDLYYLVTVGAGTGVDNKTELAVLGYAMQALHLAPVLVGPDVSHEVVRVTMEPLTTEEVSRVWSLFPTANYRTSVMYLASPVWIDRAQPPAQAAPVQQDALLAGRKAEKAMPL